MDLDSALYVYVVFIVIAFIVFWRLRIRVFSALALALILGWLLLNILIPPDCVNSEWHCGSSYFAYIFIQLGTVMYAILYTVITATQDCYVKPYYVRLAVK